MDIIEGAIETAKRKVSGYTSFCAFVDLLGISNQILEDCEAAQERIDNLHQGIASAVEIYPGLLDCKASFFGDSTVVLRELSPGEEKPVLYETFAGHIIAISRLLQETELELGHAGIRVFVSYGKLIPLSQPNEWQVTTIPEIMKDWRALTGANEAFAKCHFCDKAGSQGGFLHHHVWVEDLEEKCSFLGVPLCKLPKFPVFNEEIYPEIYRQIVREQCSTRCKLEHRVW